MGALKTVFGLVLVWVLSGTPAFSAPSLEQRFAVCAGRLSAQLEHQWLLSDPEAEMTERRRRAMVELFDAVGTGQDRARLLAVRIEAKHAHHSLLTRATFNDDPRDAQWAAHHAQLQLDDCASLLLM